MGSLDSVKTVGLCFLQTGEQCEYFIKSDDEGPLDALVSFLAGSHALIISLENFTDEETRLLREKEATCGTEVFAPSDCFGRHSLRRGYECHAHCAFKARRAPGE